MEYHTLHLIVKWTMTQEDIDDGRLICPIGIEPVRPAEFVIFRISQRTAARARADTAIQFGIWAVVSARARMPFLRLFVAVVLILTSLVGVASAAESGSIAGRVTDQTGAALPGVTVELALPNGETTAVSDASGDFRFDRVPAGSAEITFRLINFTVQRRSVTVRDTQTSTSNVVMQLSLSADVVVTGASTFRNIADIENPAENLVGIACGGQPGCDHRRAARGASHHACRAKCSRPCRDDRQSAQRRGQSQPVLLPRVQPRSRDRLLDALWRACPSTCRPAHTRTATPIIDFLIPELVSGVQFKKGPYFADEGDFSAAGAANINYVNRLERPLFELGGGQRRMGAHLRRGVAARRAAATLLGAIELNHNDGPWVRPDDYQKVNGVLRYSRGDNRNGFSLTGMGYWADWNSTDQVPDRAVASGADSAFRAPRSDRWRANRPRKPRCRVPAIARSVVDSRDGIRAAQQPEPVLELHLLPRRSGARRPVRAGGTADRQPAAALPTGGSATSSSATPRARSACSCGSDWLDPVGLYHTAARQRLSTTREDRVGQTMVGAYRAERDRMGARGSRTTFGLRADVYQFNVTSNDPLNSGEGSDGLVSPKFGAAFGPWSGTELYANAGMGFHSNDARGGVDSCRSGQRRAVDRVTPLVRATRRGGRSSHGAHPRAAVHAGALVSRLDSELLFVGDAGTTEAGRPSRRVGIEWTNYCASAPVAHRWTLMSPSLARDSPTAIRRATAFPGALDRVISGGLTVEPRQPLFGSIRVRHFGPRPLVEDASVKSKSTTLWNGEVGYRLSRASARLVLEVFNIFDAEGLGHRLLLHIAPAW